MPGGFEGLCRRILADWRLLGPLLLANALGMAFGWYYYYDVGQFDPASRYATSWWWWPLVADSPNALVVFVAAVLLRLLGRRDRWVDAAAFCLNVYVGLWTTFLFLAYPDDMGTFAGGTNSVLFVTHMGMPAQALLLVPELRRDAWSWPATAALGAALAAFVAVDYAGPHLHPAPFLDLQAADGARLLHAGSPLLAVATAAAFVLVAHTLRTGQRLDSKLRRQTP